MQTLRAPLLLTLIAVCARGQSLFTLTSGHPKAPGITNLSAVAVTDCSGDRRLDAVIAGKGYQLFYSGADGASLATTTSDPAAFSPASAVVSTDFNSDGIPDIAVASGAGGVTVFAGQTAAGSCSYSNVASFSAGPGSLPAAMVSADFNRDGKVDLAVASAGANEVRIFLGNGNGTFQSPGTAIVIGTTPKSMVIADFDADGRFDLAVASAVQDKVKILKGDGAGGFVLLAGDNGTSQAGPKGVTVADFNADGKPDLVVTDNGGQSVSVLLGNGDGTFTGLHTGAGSYALGYPPVDITTGDFDGDGRPDLAIAIAVAHATAGVSVWLGQGNGNFSQAAGSPFATGVGNPAAIVAADLNGDTRPDLWAVGNAGLSVLENAWPGIVAPAQLEFHATVGQNPAAISASLSGAPGPYTVRSTAAWLSAAASGATLTISADTAAMAPGSYSGTVWVTAPGAYGAPIRINLTIAAPSGTLVEAPGSPVTDIGEIPHLADVNLDGKLDLLFTGYPSVSGLEQLRVLLGDGTGGFAPPPSGGTVAVPNPTLLAVADFNGDGRPDAAITSYPRCTLRVYLGDGAGGFTGAVSYQLFAPCPQGIVAADWNLDGKVDLAVERRGSYTIYLGNGDGTFTAGALEASGGCNAPFLATADFNLDGKPDLAFSEGCTPSRVIVRYGDGRGGFPTSTAFAKSDGGIFETFAGDLDGDGKPDLAAGTSSSTDRFLTNGAATFARSTIFLPQPESIAGADMNGDGKLDLAGAAHNFGEDSLLVAITDSPFQLTIFNLPAWQSIAAGDLNGDGRTDVVAYRQFATSNQLRILLGAKTSSTSTMSASVSSPSTVGQPVTFTATVAGIAGPGWCVGCSRSFALPTGTVTFKDGATVLATAPLVAQRLGSRQRAIATFTTSALALGTHNLSVDYSGDVRAEPSSGSLTHLVQPRVAFPQPPGVLGAAMLFDVRVEIQNYTGGVLAGYNVPVTLTLSGPGVFASGGNALTVAAVNGVATFTGLSVRAVGAYTLTATAAGIIAGSTTLTIQTNPLAVQPAALAFQGVAGRAAPAAQTVTVSIPTGSPSYTAAASQPWILAPASGTLPGAVLVSVRTTGLQPGNYSGVITLTPESGYDPATIAVALTLRAANEVTAQPAALSVNVVVGAADTVHTVQLGSAAPLVCSAVSSATWLRAPPAVNVPGPLALTIDPRNLAVATYSGTITLTCAGADNSPVVIPVTLTVHVPPSLSASPADLRFQYEIAGPLPGVQEVHVENSGGGTLALAARPSVAWLKTTTLPYSASQALVRVWVDPAGLSPGTYTGIVFIGSGLEVPVKLVVTPQPRLTANAADLSFRAVQGGENPPEQILYFTAGGRPVKFTLKLSGAWLRVLVVNASTLAPANLRVRADLTGLAPGTYRGAIEIIAPEAVNSPLVIPVLLVVDAQPPVFSAVGIVNAASLQPGPVTSGEMVRLKGPHLSCNSAPDILVDGQRVNALAANADEITWIVPPSVAGKTEVSVAVSCNGVASAGVKIPVAESAPGIFTVAGTGRGQAAVLNQDYSTNGAPNAAAIGSIVMFFGTGFGPVRSGDDGLERLVQPVTASIGGVTAEVVWAGSAPGKPGIQQINVRISADAPSGSSVAAVVRAGQSQTQADVTLAIANATAELSATGLDSSH